MNVLEKILEEIEEATFQEDAPIYIGNMEVDGYVLAGKVKEIIRSHMNEKEKVTSAEIISRKTDGKPYYGIKYKKVGEDHYTVGYCSYYLDYVIDWLNNYFEFCGEPKIAVDVGKDTNVLINDDMEEKIREHIAECLHRTDNIRSFIGSKEYTNNDEKCIRNIEVLKTSITAMEGYLSSKKKSGNDGWIPVGERLPEVNEVVIVTVHHSEWTSDYASDWIPPEEKTYHPESYGVYAGMLKKDKKWEFYDEYMQAVSCEKEFGNDKGRIYDVIIAWLPLPEPYRRSKKEKSSCKEHIMSRFMKVE